MASSLKENDLQERYFRTLKINSKDVPQKDLMSLRWVNMMIERVEFAKQIVEIEGDETLHPVVKDALEKYNVVVNRNTRGKQKRLILKKCDEVSGGEVVPLTETFPVMMKAHKLTNHGDVETMAQWMSTSNIVVSHICLLTIVQVCEHCKRKATEVTAKPCEEKTHKTIGLIDIVDMSAHELPDDSFDFLLIYQDNNTKFLQLRPLSSADLCDSISNELAHLFSDLGPPECITVQPELADIFKNVVNNRLNIFFSSKISIELGETSVRNVSLKVKSALSAWIDRNVESKWCIGCYIVQWEINNTCDENGKSPFRRVFGKRIKTFSRPSVDKNIIPTEPQNVTN